MLSPRSLLPLLLWGFTIATGSGPVSHVSGFTTWQTCSEARTALAAAYPEWVLGWCELAP